MLLKKIKLAGFKSFVDPTTLDFRGRLVGVVGPNGCGKSNIIDAVRWVMGESSAKTLRGESMADVIFNGSSTRQPVGQASVDLIFDNSDGTVKGEFASYAEITIRREVTRDGQSNYYLNNTRCRKRDIVDVFLGTGLGPRSYSIIEQGMISRIIEAKPEDLRSFFEEAAGISIYKKRRHETNLRMNHTRDNLTRIADICREQTAQLEKLAKQSEAAIRYQEYQTEKKTIEIELLSLRWRDYDAKLQTSSEQIRTLAAQLEEKLSNRVNAETKLEKIRLENIEKTDNFNEIQSRFYDIGAQIARREQTLQHHQERMQQLRVDLAEIQQQEGEIQVELDKDGMVLQSVQAEFVSIKPQYEQAAKGLAIAQADHQQAKSAMQKWQEHWGTLQEASHKLQEKAEIEKIRIEQLERQTREYQIRLDRLFRERDSLDVATSEKAIVNLAEEYAAIEVYDKEVRLALDQISHEISTLLDLIKQEQRAANEIRGELQILKGKKASLETLQQAALGKENSAAAIAWLQQQGVTNFSRVAELIQVDSGWEKAVEIVLGEYLEYICVDHDFDGLISKISSSLALNLNLWDPTLTPVQAGVVKQQSLLSKIKNNNALKLDGLLAKIYLAADLESALAQRKSLAVDESIIVKSGVWLGANWIRVLAEDAYSGILHREQELKNITLTLATLANDLQIIEHNIAEQETVLVASQGKQLDLQKEVKTHEQNLRAKSNELSVAKTRQQNLLHRVENIQAEINEYNEQIAVLAEEVCQSRSELEIAINAMSKFIDERTLLTNDREVLQQTLTLAEKQMHECREATHKLEITKHTLEAQATALSEGVKRLNKQLETIKERAAMLNKTLSEDDSPIDLTKMELETLLEQRMLVEEDLHAARIVLEELEQTIAVLEKDRQQQEKLAQEIRTQLDTLRMDWQSLKVRCQTAEENLLALQVDLLQAVAQLPVNANESEWTANLEKFTKRIERLGPINLAAVEEYKTELERQTYLQAQHKDLEEALQILEQAIGKIDKETRARFKETFEQVSQNFQKLFPKLFGGGQAYLELTENDMLDAGITVMARPPGKKNSTIHLLSGGEKALTAVALVFSIFQLNPAPFCMLDEVDAPLDDANVGRYCNMIKEMSDAVQFIFITHNKVTMEIAKQLAGVTMKEPGVSRLVSVDIDEAIEMVAA